MDQVVCQALALYQKIQAHEIRNGTPVRADHSSAGLTAQVAERLAS